MITWVQSLRATWRMEGTDSSKLSSELYAYVLACKHIQTYKQTNKLKWNYLKKIRWVKTQKIKQSNLCNPTRSICIQDTGRRILVSNPKVSTSSQEGKHKAANIEIRVRLLKNDKKEVTPKEKKPIRFNWFLLEKNMRLGRSHMTKLLKKTLSRKNSKTDKNPFKNKRKVKQ